MLIPSLKGRGHLNTRQVFRRFFAWRLFPKWQQKYSISRNLFQYASFLCYFPIARRFGHLYIMAPKNGTRRSNYGITTGQIALNYLLILHSYTYVIMFTFTHIISIPCANLFLAILITCNNKIIGLYYLYIAYILGISATLCSNIIRIELYSSGNKLIMPENQNYYNFSFTFHGILMIFFLLMPALFSSLGNFNLPFFLAATELPYARMNSLSLLLMPVSYGSLILSTSSEFGGATAWTIYPPLCTCLSSLSPNAVDLMLYTLVISGISSLYTSINFLTTLYHMRSLGLSVYSISTSISSLIITGELLIITLPLLSAGLLMLLWDIHFNTMYFDPIFSGDPVFYEHLFWFFAHPEVYILILPGFGIISLTLCILCGKIIYGIQSMVLAMGSISILGTVVWAHHIYTVGLEADTRAYFTGLTIMISMPTSTKVFNWLFTFMAISIFNYSSINYGLFIINFIFTFTFGGTTGVILGNTAVDVVLHDTYYVVAHFHFVLSLGAAIALLTSIYSLFESLFGSYIFIPHSSNIYSIFHFFLTFIGIIITFSIIHSLGFQLMARRIPDFPDFFNSWNYQSSLGSQFTLLAISTLYK